MADKFNEVADKMFGQKTDEPVVTSVDPSTEPHIVIGDDRTVTVPSELTEIGVQYDHNIETVTFDCPRYWDGHDLSQMKIYINYMRADGETGSCLAANVTTGENDTMNFDWVISRHVTEMRGSITFLVCAKSVDSEGNEAMHWNSKLCKDALNIAEGMEVNETIIDDNPDVITQILTRLDNVEEVVGNVEIPDGSIAESKIDPNVVSKYFKRPIDVTLEKASKELGLPDNSWIMKFPFGDFDNGLFSYQNFRINVPDEYVVGDKGGNNIYFINGGPKRCIFGWMTNTGKLGSRGYVNFKPGDKTVFTFTNIQQTIDGVTYFTFYLPKGLFVTDPEANSVKTVNIQDAAVTEAKLAEEVKTKLNRDFTLADGSVTEAKLAEDVKTKLNKTPEIPLANDTTVGGIKAKVNRETQGGVEPIYSQAICEKLPSDINSFYTDMMFLPISDGLEYDANKRRTKLRIDDRYFDFFGSELASDGYGPTRELTLNDDWVYQLATKDMLPDTDDSTILVARKDTVGGIKARAIDFEMQDMQSHPNVLRSYIWGLGNDSMSMYDSSQLFITYGNGLTKSIDVELENAIETEEYSKTADRLELNIDESVFAFTEDGKLTLAPEILEKLNKL